MLNAFVSSAITAVQTNPWAFGLSLSLFLLALSVAAIVWLLVLLDKRGQAAKVLFQRLEAESEKTQQLEKTVAQLRSQPPPPPPPPPPEPTPEETEPGPAPMPETAEHELFGLTKDYLVREFVELVGTLAPTGYDFPTQPLELPPRQAERVRGMLEQLEKISVIGQDHGLLFPLEYYQAKTALHVGRHETGPACDTLAEAVRLYPHESSLLPPLARFLSVLNRDQEAAQVLERYLETNPTDSAALHALVRSLLRLGDAAKAETACRTLVQTGLDPSYRALLGLCLFRRGLVSRAEEITEPLRNERASPATEFYLGLIEEEKGRFKDALQRLGRAKSSGLDDPELLRSLVRINAILGYHPANRKLMEEARSRPDLDTTALILFLETTTLPWNETRLYLSLCERLVDLRRTDALAFVALSTVLLRVSRNDEALQAVEQARGLAPDHPVVLSRAIRILLDRKDLGAAAGLIGHGLAVAPAEPLFTSLRCEHLGLSGDRETALAEARQAVHRFPHTVPNLELFARLLLRLGEGREALHLLLRIEQAGVKSPSLYNLIGSACFLLKDHAEAAKAWHRTLELDPRNLEALNNLGVVHGLRREYRQAKKMFSRALQIDPASKQTHYNLARLHRLINQEAETHHMTRYRQLVGG